MLELPADPEKWNFGELDSLDPVLDRWAKRPFKIRRGARSSFS